MDKPIRLAILGSTGSIGQQTMDVVRHLPQHFQIVALAAGQNVDLLAEQVKEFHPRFIYTQDKAKASAFSNLKFLSLEEMAAHPDVDVVVVATSGKAGLLATLAAVKAGKKVAISNKEPLVMAGSIITTEAQKYHATILPVDSEHSAIWQCLKGELQKPAQIILTASGGPFRNQTIAQMSGVTAAQALNHPSWQMGKKVTIDSATLMNKGLEVMEARWLFGVPIEKIRILVHPQSIIHSMVEFEDGSVKAQLACPDMRLPIQYALTYPDRIMNPVFPHLDWDKIKGFDFQPPDFVNFPCLKLAIEAGKTGGTMPTVLCAADEIAVGLFLKNEIKFTDIAVLVEKALTKHKPAINPSLDEIMDADAWARRYTLEAAEKAVR